MIASLRGTACRVFIAALFVSVVARPARAGWGTFDFNSVTPASGYGDNSAVQTYMTNALIAQAAGMTVTVTGATATNIYTGDNRVVGPVDANNVVKPLTLGTTEGGDPIKQAATTDTFIDTQNSTEIDMTFSKKIYQVSFDYEIFPNANCTVSNCADVPDFTFKANGVTYASALAKNVTALPFTHSVNSTASANETAMQLGPKFTGIITFTNGVTALQFIDWPVTIGIDNLKVNTNAPVPEPATMLLLGSGLAAAYAKKRRDQRKTSTSVA